MLTVAYSEIKFDSYLKEAEISGAPDPPERRATDIPVMSMLRTPMVTRSDRMVRMPSRLGEVGS